MDEFAEQAQELLSLRVQQVREKHEILSRAEKTAEMEKLNRIMFSLADEDREWLDAHMTEDVLLKIDACEALYRAGLKDGLRLLKLLVI